MKVQGALLSEVKRGYVDNEERLQLNLTLDIPILHILYDEKTCK